MKTFFQRHNDTLIALILLTAVLWGGGRLYFAVTDGFRVSNIISTLPYQPNMATRELTKEESLELKEALSQPYHYLGKGCQSYVFESRDGRYVVKFFKYQRFTPQVWLEPLGFIPQMKEYLDKKQIKKEAKLTFFREAWKIAFDELKEECGLVYMHLNKSDHLNKNFTITDKMGREHVLPADQLEFLIQRKADRLVPWLEKSEPCRAKELLSQLVDQIVSEYQRGLSDNDPALMQNTGVFSGRPFHIDVGQFTKEERFKDPLFWHQDLFNKTYELRLWLIKNHPELGEHLTEKLQTVIGEDWCHMRPFFGRIHQ